MENNLESPYFSNFISNGNKVEWNTIDCTKLTDLQYVSWSIVINKEWAAV